ncbi:hypothetical protein LRU_01245 [Ligilactobacillus ruminis SPM0211]|uniref:Uncharacterized protein n=1 Tax=Ligilactobacillus ruminis SPM0211 TaxID=1040964 RepID=F7R0B6_9LACO|nr:hypothetical protein LRU_01245 [Ligilactobacillus ruminis SPM0211]
MIPSRKKNCRAYEKSGLNLQLIANHPDFQLRHSFFSLFYFSS